MARPDSLEEVEAYRRNLGVVVHKKSKKPFKSRLSTATVRGFTTHPVTGRLCYLFVEDDSYVECRCCEPLRKVQPDAVVQQPLQPGGCEGHRAGHPGLEEEVPGGC